VFYGVLLFLLDRPVLFLLPMLFGLDGEVGLLFDDIGLFLLDMSAPLSVGTGLELALDVAGTVHAVGTLEAGILLVRVLESLGLLHVALVLLGLELLLEEGDEHGQGDEVEAVEEKSCISELPCGLTLMYSLTRSFLEGTYCSSRYWGWFSQQEK